MFVLLSGSLHRDPAARQSNAGRQYVTALVRAGAPTETVWANVIAFDTAAQSQLLRLQGWRRGGDPRHREDRHLREKRRAPRVRRGGSRARVGLAPAEADETEAGRHAKKSRR
jgi:hypothetical protein